MTIVNLAFHAMPSVFWDR